MPTIDELAPATAASDTDELLVSQSGIVRKVTRAQVLAGTQPAIAVSNGVLLGRSSSGVGAPEQITIGSNLILSGGMLTAEATPYVVGSLPAGNVPSLSDVVPLGQGGSNVAVTYSQFMSSLPGVPNLDASAMLITPAGATSGETIANFASTVLLKSGGAMAGALTLVADPTAPLQAATKGYVDSTAASTLSITGGTMTGPLALAADPTASAQAATKHYVDASVAQTLPLVGGALAGPLMLAADPTTALQAATKEYVDARLMRSGDTLTGPIVLAADPTAPLQATTKQYTDACMAQALPLAGGILSGPLLLASDPGVSQQAATKHYVDSSVATALPVAGGALTGPLTLAADPTDALQAATKEYVDTRVLRSGDTLTGALILAADPVNALQAAPKQYVDAQVATALPLGGGTLTGALVLQTSPTTAFQAATKQYVDTGVASAVPLTGGTMTGALTLSATGTALSVAYNGTFGGMLVAGNGSSKYITLAGSSTQPSITSNNGGLTINPNGTLVINGAVQTGTLASVQSGTFQTPGNAYTLSGSTNPPYGLNIGADFAGATTSSQGAYNSISIASDTLNATVGPSYLKVSGNAGGTGFGGSRAAITGSITQNGDIGSNSLIAGQFWINVGAIAGSGLSTFYGLNPQVIIPASASGIYGAFGGGEANIKIAAGVSLASKGLWSLINECGDASHGASHDAALSISSQTNRNGTSTIGWYKCQTFGKYDGQCPVDPTGALIDISLQATNAYDITTPIKPFTSAYGLNFSVLAATAHGLRLPGAQFDGAGNLTTGALKISSSAGRVSVDASAQFGAISAIANGGKGYVVGEYVYYIPTSANDTVGIWEVAAVAEGAITLLTPILVPWSASPPSNPVALAVGGTRGLNAALALTWTVNSTLSFNPSGGPITMPLLINAANDAAAATAGVAVGQLYRNDSAIMQRVA